MEKVLEAGILEVLAKRISRQARYYLDLCSNCGICKDACHIYLATGRPDHIPAYRIKHLRQIYSRYFTLSGRFLPYLTGAQDLTEQVLEELYQAAYTCTGCKRCMIYCPFGVDITAMVAVIKSVLNRADKAPEILSLLVDTAIEKGKNYEFFREFFVDQVKELEKEVKSLSGDESAEIPLDRVGAETLYVALSGAHTIVPAAVIFNIAGEDWTLSNFEGANYGFALGAPDKGAIIAERIVAEARRLGVRRVVVTECGHAYRVLKHLDEVWSNQKFPFQVLSVLELYRDYLKTGRIKADPSRIAEPVTYHDPCQLGRNSGILDEPREVIGYIVREFREMSPSGGDNFCCGGGGGMTPQPETEPFRVKIGQVKAEQIAATGAGIVATSCEVCLQQLNLLKREYNLKVRVCKISDLLLETLSRGNLSQSQGEH